MTIDLHERLAGETEYVTLVCPTCGHLSKPVPDVVLRKVNLICNHRASGSALPPALMKPR